MKRLVFALSASLLLASCQTVAPHQASMERLGENKLDWPQQESDLAPDPAVRYGRLPNGMRYAIMANQTPSSAASFRLRFDVGSLAEQDDQRGLAHFLEHMAFNGSENVPEGEMVHVLERHGLAFGADTNASTSFDETTYTLEAPNADVETLDTIFFLLREVASKITIADDAVERERGVILSEERTRNTPGLRALMAQWDYLFPGVRFPERFPIGAIETIAHAPAQRIRDFYESYYRPERAFFVVVGDIEPAAMEARIQATFADWRARRPDPGDPDLGAPARPPTPAGHFSDPGLTTIVTLAAVAAAPREANSRASYKADLMRTIGNAIVQRRLQTLSRAPNATIQEAQAQHNVLFDSVALTQLDLVARPQDWQAALALGEQELRRALTYGFTRSEIDEQLSQYRTAYRTAAERASTRRNNAIANSIVDEFSNWGVFMAPADELALFEALAADVTPAAVAAAFRDQWGELAPLLFVDTSEPIADAPATVHAAYERSRAQPVSPPTEISAQAFAYTDFGTPGRVTERRVVEDLGLIQVRYANNMRLNIKHTDFTNDSVLVSVRFGGGQLELPKDQPGLGLLISSMGAGGLEAHSADDLQRLLAGHNVSVQIGAGGDAFTLTGATTPDDLQLELQLMAAQLTAPGYRPEGLTQFRQVVEGQFQPLAATPSGVAQRDLPRLLRSGDPRFGIAARSDLLARTFDEARAALARASGAGTIEVGIVGDVETDVAIDIVARTFGALPPRNANDPPFGDARRLAFPAPRDEALVLRHEGAPTQAQALVYWPAADDSDSRRARTLELLRSVLSLKLIARVREAEGATYSPSAQMFLSRVNPGYGYFGVALDLAPSEVDRFFGVVDEIAGTLASGQITADELERARRPVLDALEQNQEDNRYWLGLAARAQSDPEVLARHRRMRQELEAVTIADLRAAAARYLTPRSAYRIAILPPEAH
ncbi:MAG: insulinase family protein [Terricaulis sp.]